MKTCLIWGDDGLDLDITYNLVSFYKNLGFKTFFSWSLHKADILVVTRAVDSISDIPSFGFPVIHIFDYTGWDYDSFLLNINHDKTFIFCTSEEKKAKLIAKNHFPGDHIFLALPPVDTTLWSSKPEEVKYEFIHIGNYKTIPDNDYIKEKFDLAVGHFKTHIWGTGWGMKNELYHGKAGLFRVSSIYAMSKFAFGLMYPFQREITFSGRFWHAPLNGCFLFSEPGLYSRKIPGIIETDYTIEDIERKTASRFNREELKQKAQEYWKEQNSITKKHVESTLLMLNENDFSLFKFLIYKWFRLVNILIKLYQKCKGVLTDF